MKSLCGTVLVAALLIPMALRSQQPDADSLFVRGELEAARAAYQRRIAAAPEDQSALTRLGLIALWDNQLLLAESLLVRATALDSTDRTSLEALAESLYRQSRFAAAAPLNRKLGRIAAAAKLESLVAPYDVSLPPEGTRVSFAPGAILPVLTVRVNGQDAFFLLDTGAGETIIDDEMAKRIGARTFGIDSGAYAAGRMATFIHGTVDSVAIGEATLRRIPVHVQSTRAFAPAAGGRTVSGIIGTGVLAQFQSEIDFGGWALSLRPRDTSLETDSSTALRFWWLGDHFITTRATLSNQVTTFLVFDTGLAMPGGALVPSASLLAEAGMHPDGSAVTGVGGGGSVTVTPFRIGELRVGGIVKSDLMAVAGAFPPMLEYRFGPRIGGLLSHGFFAGERVTLDFQTMRLIVRSAVATVSASAPSVPNSAAVPATAPVTHQARAQQIVDLLNAGRYEELTPFWSDQLLAQIPPQSLGSVWENLVATLGAVTQIQSPRVIASGEPRSENARTVDVPVRFGHVLIGITMTFDESQRVTSIAMQPLPLPPPPPLSFIWE
jgi:gag-polyprotein putative aspartyl protease/Protein of unknown function (DUF3887)